jgi:hypothetical protein
VARDPYPLLARLRRETPVAWIERAGCFLVTRYDDCVSVLTRPALFASTQAGAEETGSPGGAPPPVAVAAEVATHVRYRTLVAGALSGEFVAALEGEVARLTGELLDAVPATGTIDLIPALAAPLPTRVLARLLGVADESRAAFTAWGEAYSRSKADGLDARARAGVREAVAEALGHFAYLLARRQAEPAPDLLGRLLAVHAGEARLTPRQVLGLCDQLMIAGRDLTAGLIGNALAALLGHPAQLARLRAEPGCLEGAIEEALRWDTPVLGQARVSRDASTLRGVPIPAGRTVVVLFAAANRDPAVFAAPDRFDIGRGNAGQHLAFGRGLHFCLGAALARLEARVAVRALLARWPRIRPDPGRPAERRAAPLMVNLRAFRSLPVLLGPG